MPILTEASCRECHQHFIPARSDQKFCSTRCGARYRYDQTYFGGRRKTATGLVEGVCQVCHSQPRKGLSVHHVTGDPEGELVAVCRGCHRLITELSRRRFVSDPKSWERLIRFTRLRKGLPDTLSVR